MIMMEEYLEFIKIKNDFIDYKTEYHSLMISNCNYPHEVTKVLHGNRKSLVFFFAHHNKMNRRANEL